MAHELVYCAEDETEKDEIHKMIMARFPTAVIEVDYDCIHGYRLDVDIADVAQMDYYEWALVNKIARRGLCFGLDARMRPQEIMPLVMRLKEQGKELG